MSWPKGVTKEKCGGRQKGTPNRKTLVLEEILAGSGINVVEKLLLLLLTLPNEKQADVLLSLMNYLYPRRKAVEYFHSESRIEETIKNLSEDEIYRRAIKVLKRLKERFPMPRPDDLSYDMNLRSSAAVYQSKADTINRIHSPQGES